MATTPKFLGTIKEGKPVFDNRAKLLAYCAGFPDETRFECLIRKQTKRRSDAQNKYYWGVVIPTLGMHFGYNKDEMHDALKWQFLIRTDVELPTVRSTASLTTAEFKAFVDEVVIWAATDYQVVIPDPDETDY